MIITESELTQGFHLLHSGKGCHVNAIGEAVHIKGTLVAPARDFACLKLVLKVCELGVDLTQGGQRLSAIIEGVQVAQQTFQVIPARRWASLSIKSSANQEKYLTM